jgi:hypothetical protein
MGRGSDDPDPLASGMAVWQHDGSVDCAFVEKHQRQIGGKG